jgi:hypothetical protein
MPLSEFVRVLACSVTGKVTEPTLGERQAEYP